MSLHEAQRLYHITLLFSRTAAAFPEGLQPLSQYKEVKIKVTRASFSRAVYQRGGVAVIPLAAFEVAGQNSEEMQPEDVGLHDGATFIVVQKPDPFFEEVKEQRGYRRTDIASQENQGREHAKDELESLGDTHVTALCKKKVSAANGGYKELDGVAIGDHDALIVEAKAKLSGDAAEELVKKRDFIIANEVPEFKGKKIRLALQGKVMPTDAADQRRLLKLCREHGIAIWLPNPVGIGTGDSCTQSPVQHSPVNPSSRGASTDSSRSGGTSSGGSSVAAAAVGSAGRAGIRPGQLRKGSALLGRTSARMPHRRWPLQQGAALVHRGMRGSCRYISF